MAKPIRNVLLFLTDQQRKDSIGAYGNRIARTPNLDRLAAEGTRFERAYCQNPFCCPARASLLTGLHPRTHGVWHNGIQFSDIGAPTLGDHLQAHGFRTCSVGKIHLNSWFGPHPPSGYEESQNYWKLHPEIAEWRGPYCGFQEVDLVVGHVHYATKAGHYAAYLQREFPRGLELMQRAHALEDREYFETWRNAMPEEHHYNTWIANRTIEAIDRFREDRFFIHCSFPDPHHPFSACEPYASMFAPEEMPDPIPASIEELRGMPPVYLDQHLGRPNAYSGKPAAYAERAAGAPLKAMAAQMYGMIAHVDRCIGRVLDHLAARGLLEETLVIFTSDHGELLGDHGFTLKGPFYYQSLLNIPLIVRAPGGRASAYSALAAHVDLVPTALEMLGLETPSFLPGRSLRGALAGEPAAARDAVLTEFRPFGMGSMKVLHTNRWKYVYYAGQPHGELFDLERDPGEHRNLFSDPEHAEIRTGLHARLLDELVATEAPWPARGAWT